MRQNNENGTWVWRWNDPDHLEAHRDEFSRPVEEILEELRPLVEPLFEKPGHWLHRDWELAEPTGLSGLRSVVPDGSESFWAYRRGRTIPSHLCLGERRPTRSICLWGWWESDAFVIHTIYPGTVAPREIHDPQIDLKDLPAAIEFWRTHAIVTEEGRYTTVPGKPREG